MQVAAGTRFGPFLGKWVLEPQREEHAWEVSEALLSFWQLCLYRGVKTFFQGIAPSRGKHIPKEYIIYHLPYSASVQLLLLLLLVLVPLGGR